MKRVFKESSLDFKRSYGKYLSFELVYSILSSIVFAPFLAYVFNRLIIMFRKSPALINNDVLSFGFSFKGMLAIFLIGLLVAAILFIEFGVIIIISHKSYFKKPILITQAIKKAFKKLPRIIGIGIFQLFFLVLLFIPWVDAATFPILVDINKTVILTNLFNESLIMKGTYLVVFLLFVYLFIRLIFSLHFIFLENLTVWQALKNSWTITKRRHLRLIIYIVILNVVIFSFGIILMTVVSQFASIIESKAIGHFVGNYLLTFSSYVTILISLFLIPLNIIILTRLFYRFLKQSGYTLHDNLIVSEGSLLQRFEKRIKDFFVKRKLVIRMSIVAILSVMFLINYTTSDAVVVYLPWDVQVVAHRGDGFHSPENSMAGIQSAVEKRVDAVEIDVALTKDKVMVLSHDSDLKRIAGRSELIAELTFDELQEIDIGKHFDEEFTGEKIPSLAEAMDLIAETEINVIIDVKVEDEDAEEYAEQIVDMIQIYDAEDLALVQSFNNKFLREMRQLNPEIEIGQILYLSIGNISQLDVDFYTIRQTMLTDRFINEAHQKDRDVWVWTVNHPRNIKEVLKYDVEGIITDYPERVHQLLERK